MKTPEIPLLFHRRLRVLPSAVALVFAMHAEVQARNLIGISSTSTSQAGSASAASTSQTATAATTAAAQAAQAAFLATRAQDSLIRTTAAFQNLAAQQAAARAVPLANPNNVVTATDGSGATDGLGVGLLEPVGGVPATTSAGVQIVTLGGTGKNSLLLTSSGTVTLPKGTSGNDQITLTGSGKVVSTGGTVSITSGSLTTSTSATLNATSGGTIALSGTSDSISSGTAATITSTAAGTITLPAGGGTMALAANQSVTLPAGSSVAFTGTGTVTVSGAGTVSLAGAGTLSLASGGGSINGAVSGSGGTITTNSTISSFTNGAETSLPAGSSIDFSSGGLLSFQGTGTDKLPVIIEPNTTTSATSSTPVLTTPSFTTSGSILNTTGYQVPSSGTYAWSGVSALSQSETGTGPVVVTVTQDAQQALLYWSTFNIGKNTILDFDQSAGGALVGDWVAINRILDPSLAPSRILGSIEAPGQVYVINQNGIIFGGSSQVNTHALVASSLPINENLVQSGLLNNPNGQYLFSSELIPSNGSDTAYDPNNDPYALPNATSGPVSVQEGAMLGSPGSAEGVGGRIALLAPQVVNQGTLSAPDGQIILAAGQQVGIEPHPSADPSLRGLDIAIGAANGPETVTNDTTGYIYAPEADVTLAAPTINQNGQIDSFTSVTLNGRIDMIAGYNFGALQVPGTSSYIFSSESDAVGGTINLGPGSLTAVLPDYTSTDTENGTSLALPSQIYAEGTTFHMQSGAALVAPNATLTLSFGYLNTPITLSTAQQATSPKPTPLPEDVGADSTGVSIAKEQGLASTGTVELDDIAAIDVSGSSDVQASVTENIVQAELTEAVLENSPLQESGALRGDTVTVDVSQTGTNADGSTWYGSPIGDLSGYANLIEHNVGELTIAGGNIQINTSGAVTTAPTSTINVSGGSIDYQGAEVETSLVETSSGQMLSIAKASPTETYEGLVNNYTVTSTKWGFTQTFANPLQLGSYYDAGYVTGGAGGSLVIDTESLSLLGAVYGNTTTGVRQQAAPPASSSFSLKINSNAGVDPTTYTLVIQAPGDAQSTAANTIYLSPDLFGVDGFSQANIDLESGTVNYNATTGAKQGSFIDVTSDAVISMLAGGSLVLQAANVEMDGQIDIPSGSVTISGMVQDTLGQINNSLPIYSPSLGVGNVTIGSTGVISVGGLVFDENTGGATSTLPFSVNGGTVALNYYINSNGTIVEGAVTDVEGSLDASAGAVRNTSGKITSGKGGTISLTGLYTGGSKADGQVILNGSLSAYGITQGGTLKITAPAVLVGSGASLTLPGSPDVLDLSTSFFSQGGFASYNITGASGVEITSGTITPVLTEETPAGTGSSFGLSTVSAAQLPPYPAAPVNLSFTATGGASATFATVDLDSGAVIDTGATGSVSFKAPIVDIDGTVSAPGGSISITADSTYSLIGNQNNQVVPPDVTVYLGSGADLSVDGVTLTSLTSVGGQFYHTGEVLPGGTISISGDIVGDPNAVLSANGAVGTIDVPYTDAAIQSQTSAFQHSLEPYVSETVGSNGGSISLNGDELLYYGGAVSAQAGNASATGGTLTIQSGLATSYAQPTAAGFVDLYISQAGNYRPRGITFGLNTAGQELTGVDPTVEGIADNGTGGGFFTVNQFNKGGFGSLVLEGNVEFLTSVDITASQEVEVLPINFPINSLSTLSNINGSIFANPNYALSTPQSISITAPYISIGASALDLDEQYAYADAPSYVSVAPTIGTTQINLSNGTTTTTNLPSATSASAAPGLAAPTYGTAQLSLNATSLIDVGFLTLQNIGQTSLSVPTGDIRGGGLFYAAGKIEMTAGQLYPSTASTFTVVAFDTAQGGTGEIDILPGSVTRPLPLSAGGTLNLYATTIDDDGTVVAPFGSINLGVGAADTVELPELKTELVNIGGINAYAFEVESTSAGDTVAYAPVTSTLTLGKDSVTSVSGAGLDIPYGTIENGDQWIAPNGQDITAGGLPAKTVKIQAANVVDTAGSSIDLSGGGTLFAYQFNPGVTGTNDILNVYKYADGAEVVQSVNGSLGPVSSTSFAIVPAYGLDYAPLDLTMDSQENLPYATAAQASDINKDLTDVNLTGQVGNEIYLAGGDGLAAGYYAILPSRYALLQGAYLVTPNGTSTPATTTVNADGSIDMAGYFTSGLNPNQGFVNVQGFQVASNSVVATRAQYKISSATTFLPAGAQASGQAVPRLPIDAGQLVFTATTGLDLEGSLVGNAAPGGLGSIVDIGATEDIDIVSDSSDKSSVPNGDLALYADDLSAFGAGSLLIGGTRTTTSSGTVINPTTSAIYLNNDAADPLSGNEIILASKQAITLGSGSSIVQSGASAPGTQEYLTIGSASTPGSGDGTLIRVSNDPDATFTRLGVNTADTTPALTIDANASLAGAGITLDSTSSSTIDPTVAIDQVAGVTGQGLVLSAGAINVETNTNTPLTNVTGLVIGNNATDNLSLLSLESSISQLTLSSYSTINLYGNGTIGTLNGQGQPVFKSLTLEGAGLYGYANASGSTGNVTINAQSVTFNNTNNVSTTGIAPTQPATGAPLSLAINAGKVVIGSNNFAIDGYTITTLGASDDIIGKGTGTLTTAGELDLETPLVTATAGSKIGLASTGGALTLDQTALSTTADSNQDAPGLGATISLTGASINLAGKVSAPSGTINVAATAGNVNVLSSGVLNVAGSSETFGTATAYSSAGQINLTANSGGVAGAGNVAIGTGATLNVSAPTGGGNAGSLNVSASGALSFGDSGTSSAYVAGGTLEATAPNGTAGSFNAMLGSVSSLYLLTKPLTDGGFTSLTFDVTSGSVTVDGPIGPAISANGPNTSGNGLSFFSLTTEAGSITVDSSINASGVNGGTIDLYAQNGVTLTSNASLSVEGEQFNAAGQGGTVDIESRSGTQDVTINPGAQINLKVDYLTVQLPQPGSGTLYAFSSPTALSLPQGLAIVLPDGSPGDSQFQFSSSGVIISANGTQTAFTANQTLSGLAAGSQIELNSAGTVTFTTNNFSEAVPYTVSGTALAFAQSTSFVLPSGTPGNDQLQFTSAGSYTSGGVTSAFTAGQTLSNLSAGTQITLANAGNVIFLSGGTGGSVPLMLPAGENFTSYGAPNAVPAAQACDVEGTLHLRALTTSNGTDLAINLGSLANAKIEGDANAQVIIEGYNTYAVTTGTITTTLENTINTDAGTYANNTDAILSRLLDLGLGVNPTAAQVAMYQVTPGAEIDNPTGNLTLASNWDLSSYRYGPNGVAGELTMRAAGNLVFLGSLTDGFAYNPNDSGSENVAGSPYTWDVQAGPSWSYRLVAGAQFNGGVTPANFGEVETLAELGLNNSSLTNASDMAGSLLLGKTLVETGTTTILGQTVPTYAGFGILTSTIAAQYAQLIRTGSGSITIDTGGSVDLMNQLSTIYTAGTVAPALAGFDQPTQAQGGQGNGDDDSSYNNQVYFGGIGVNTLSPAPEYSAQFTYNGGNIVIDAQQDIAHLTEISQSGVTSYVPDTSWQFPTNWLDRRGASLPGGTFDTTEITDQNATTSWWVNFSNFFEGIGALGGGNVSIEAGGNIVNVDAVVPTNAEMPYADSNGLPTADAAANLIEYGGGNLSVVAGGTIEGGTYYVEKGLGTIDANTITSATDAVRVSGEDRKLNDDTPLPLTLFVGDSSFNVEATNNVTIGSAVNPFWLPQGLGNNFQDLSIFSTYGQDSSVNVSSLLGNISYQSSELVVSFTTGNIYTALPGGLYEAYFSDSSPNNISANSFNQSKLEDDANALLSGPWDLTMTPTGGNATATVANYAPFFALNPPTLTSTAFSGNIQIEGSLLLAPSSRGTLQLLAAGSVEGASNVLIASATTAFISILDDSPSQLPGVTNPIGFGSDTLEPTNQPNDSSLSGGIQGVTTLFEQAPIYQGLTLDQLNGYHTEGLLHGGTTPVEIETLTGDISDFTLVSPEVTDISSGLDLQDVSLYLQNNTSNDVSVVAANRDITLYDPLSAGLVGLGAANSTSAAYGDLQIGGPGTLEVLAGRNLTLGQSTPNAFNTQYGLGLGINSIGNSRDPYLPFGGANVIAAAGVGDNAGLSSNSQTLNYAAFNNEFITGTGAEPATYLPDLGALLGVSSATDAQIADIFTDTTDSSLTTQELQLQQSLAQSPEARDAFSTDIFYDVLRDAGRQHDFDGSNYTEGYAAIKALFPDAGQSAGNLSVTSREIKTTNIGDIDILIPGGSLEVGVNNSGAQAVDQGILTVSAGNISIFANNNIDIGTSRIFTLHGGNIIIWSTVGDIDAGASSRTVQSAPPTRVLVDTQSANVQTDLAGLATGGGIGVLETIVGAPPGDVDLIAPVGTVNAGDAGIRASGNISIAAALVLNAGNIQAGGSTTGVPASSVPNISANVAASNAAGSSQGAANSVANRQQAADQQPEDVPSIISVEVIGYGGGDSASDEPQKKDSASTTYVADRP
jgi:filamentous hemagglutinin family protein